MITWFNMIKQILTFTAVFFAVSTLKAQSIDQRVFDFLGSNTVNKLQQTDPDSLMFLNYIVVNGYAIQSDVPDYKLEGLKKLSEIELSVPKKKYKTVQDLSNFNRLEVLDLNPNPLAATIYHIDGTSSVLILKPFNELKLIFDSTN